MRAEGWPICEAEDAASTCISSPTLCLEALTQVLSVMPYPRLSGYNFVRFPTARGMTFDLSIL